MIWFSSQICSLLPISPAVFFKPTLEDIVDFFPTAQKQPTPTTAIMPSSRRRHSYDDFDYGPRDSRDHSRTRHRRAKSSYDDDRYDGPRRGRRHYDSDDDDYVSVSPPPRRHHAHPERHSRRARSRTRSAGGEMDRERRDQAIKSALTAGAVEAFRQRNRSGDWVGSKGLRVATAAASAAAIDTAVDKDPRRKGKRNIVGSTLGGLLVDRLASGIGGGRRG